VVRQHLFCKRDRVRVGEVRAELHRRVHLRLIGRGEDRGHLAGGAAATVCSTAVRRTGTTLRLTTVCTTTVHRCLRTLLACSAAGDERCQAEGDREDDGRPRAHWIVTCVRTSLLS